MWIGGVLIMGLFIWLLVSLVTRPNNPYPPINHHFSEQSPADILKKRYARGEITKEELEEMLRNVG